MDLEVSTSVKTSSGGQQTFLSSRDLCTRNCGSGILISVVIQTMLSESDVFPCYKYNVYWSMVNAS